MAIFDLGVDLDCVDDITPSLRVVGGRVGLAQAIARRLQTPRGGLFYDPDYGFDVRRFLNEGAGPETVGQIAAGVEAEAEKDDRVVQAAAAVAFIQPDTLSIRLTITDGAGPFQLVLMIDAVTITLLRG